MQHAIVSDVRALRGHRPEPAVRAVDRLGVVQRLRVGHVAARDVRALPAGVPPHLPRAPVPLVLSGRERTPPHTGRRHDSKLVQRELQGERQVTSWSHWFNCVYGTNE